MSDVPDAAALLAAASALAGEPLSALTAVRGGGNNRLYRATGATRSYALKQYPDDPVDARSRYEREFGGLRFLWDDGERRIPEPIGLDASRGIALFGWVAGEPVGARGAADVDALAAFLASLHERRTRPGSATLPLAREAVLAPAELVDQLHARLERLRGPAAEHPELRAVVGEIEAALARVGERDRAPLAPGLRTLSPSDVGFHNALRGATGLVFLDFEYFGWDDPVKLVADVVWHPGMTLDGAERQRFFARATDVYSVDSSFFERFERDAPLYGLRWALIVLNEFLPDAWARRVAAGERSARPVALARQLAKARGFVERAATGALLA